jgi:branched-chain amino acid transport system ATP-binding protein
MAYLLRSSGIQKLSKPTWGRKERKLALLETSGLKAYYATVEVLRGVNFYVNEREIVSVIGPNGAGKSTFLKAIFRLVKSAGEIFLDGESLVPLSTREVVERGASHCPEGRQLFPHMSAQDNLRMGAYLVKNRERIKADMERVYDLFPILRERKRQLAGTMSGGEQQMLAIGRGIVSNPRILLLDEPSLGLAPLVIDKIFEVIKQLNRNGLTLLLVEQNASVAMEISYRTYVLEEGNIRHEGISEELIKDPKIKESYLGMT